MYKQTNIAGNAKISMLKNVKKISVGCLAFSQNGISNKNSKVFKEAHTFSAVVLLGSNLPSSHLLL
jgi:hypothetical protein